MFLVQKSASDASGIDIEARENFVGLRIDGVKGFKLHKCLLGEYGDDLFYIPSPCLGIHHTSVCAMAPCKDKDNPCSFGIIRQEVTCYDYSTVIGT